MSQFWTRTEYEREKRNFIETRLRFRSVYLHSVVIFSVTWLSGWLWSAVLLKFGLVSMPLRYAISFVLAYVVFLGAVRVWADCMKSERDGGSWDGAGLDAAPGDLGEGCFFVLAAMLIAFVVAGLFTLTGGLPLLLEAAFEVVFAGMLVRRLSRIEVMGNWAGRLFRSTWIHAGVTLLVLVAIAAGMQKRAPEAKTFSQAIKSLLGQSPVKK
jgi:hypothetical protein